MNPYSSGQPNSFAIDVALSSRISELEERVAELEHSKLDLKDELAALARKRITAALVASGGNKTKAARLLGLPSYQTLNNWVKQYDVVESEND